MAQREIDALRARVLKRHRAASKKVSRLKNKADGVDVSGTRHDVRVSPEQFKKWNTKQLLAHEAKLNSFVSRETQFVKGAGNAILPAGGKYGVKRHQQLQDNLGKAKKASLDKIADIYIPSQGMTIGERVEMTTPKHPTMAPPASYAPHLHFTKTPKGIPSENALKKLVKDLEGKQGQAYFDKKFESQHKAARKMVRGIRNKGLSADFKTLTPEEFNILWNYTNFAEVASLDYVIRKSMLHDKKELAWYDVALDTQLREARARIGEIKALKLDSRLRDNNKP